MRKSSLIAIFALLSIISYCQPDNSQHLASCSPAWQYAVMGNPIGDRTLHATDIDNNGKEEIVCGTSYYWYILSFNSLKNDYDCIWFSDNYESMISRINVVDINNDNSKEICVGLSDGTLHIYSGTTRALIKTIRTSSGNGLAVTDVEYGDIDNDGVSELVVSNSAELIIFNATDFTVKMTLPYAAFDFKIANVDGDVSNEIITSQGYVLQFDGSSVQVQWIFSTDHTNYPYRIKVSDLDQDGKDEIIYIHYDIIVYDADLQTTKFTIDEDNTISDAVILDVNNDGIQEIIYGEYTWDYNLHCVSSLNQAQLWLLAASVTGITDVCAGDVDGNGKPEILCGTGNDGSQADHLEIFDVTTHLRKWKSKALDGPFYAVEIGDVNNDGKDEIVTVSTSSSHAYESGILSIFRAGSHELEWQSTDQLFNNNVNGIYDVKIKDVDNDGKKEIIVAGGDWYRGKIWIIDGITKQVKSSHTFASDEVISYFTNFTVDDIDADGQQEIIATTGYNYYVINPLNFGIEYISPVFGSAGIAQVKVGNLNADQSRDLVFCGSQMVVFNGLTNQMIKSPNAYASFDLYDMNGDGIDEIVAGNFSGSIFIMNGITLQPIDTVKIASGVINGIAVSDLNNDGQPEIVFSCNGKVYYYSTALQYAYTRFLDDPDGIYYHKLLVKDIDDDGYKDVLIGTKNKTIELTGECYACMWFVAPKIIENASCGITDGFIQLLPFGGATPYSCSWDNGMTGNAVGGLTPGTYVATLTDHDGCVISDTSVILQSVLTGNIQAVDESCSPAADGSVTTHISEGRAPFYYSWSNGAVTPSINQLHKGTYEVTISDSKNCTLALAAEVQKDTLFINAYKYDLYCYGSATGSINLFISSGTYPFTYAWNTGQSVPSLSNLPAGSYIVNVHDAAGCASVDTIVLLQPDSIALIGYTTPDNLGTPEPEGTATVTISGGIPPYSVRWDDAMQQTTLQATNLLNGNYHATVWDSHFCYKTIIVRVGKTIGITSNGSLSPITLYPNPSTGLFYVDMGSTSPESVTLMISDPVGKLVKEIRTQSSPDTKICVDLTAFDPGFYILRISAHQELYGFKIEIVR